MPDISIKAQENIMEENKNMGQENPMTYPEAFDDAVNSIFFVPEPARPALMAAFFNFMTFGIF